MSIQETVHRYIDIGQVDPLRDAAHDRPLRYDSLGRRLRDEVLVILGTDLGLRASDLRGLKESMFRLNSGEVQIPGHVQKDYSPISPDDDGVDAQRRRRPRSARRYHG